MALCEDWLAQQLPGVESSRFVTLYPASCEDWLAE